MLLADVDFEGVEVGLDLGLAEGAAARGSRLLAGRLVHGKTMVVWVYPVC